MSTAAASSSRPGAGRGARATPPGKQGALVALPPPAALAEPPLAFAVGGGGSRPGIEIRVNFGVWAGREVSSAEIDRLSRWLLDRVEQVTIVSEVRHEIDAHSEAAVHQVTIAVEPVAGAGREELEGWLVARADHWARLCLAERSTDAVDGPEALT